MQFKKGTHVYTSDHRDVGTIDRVVLDPRSDEVSGVVVRKGWLFTEDKVVPIGVVDSASEDAIQLSKNADDLQQLPEFEETYYVRASDMTPNNDPTTVSEAPPYPDPVYAYPPVGTAWWGYGTLNSYVPDYPPDYVQKTQQNIPEGTVAVREGARVLSLEGDHVGNVEQVFTDETTNQVTHLVISQGLLFKNRKLIPSNWVQNAGEDDVMLTVSTSVINDLPEYQAAVHQ